MYGSESVLGIRIRIHKALDYGSNTDLDPPVFNLIYLFLVDDGSQARHKYLGVRNAVTTILR